MTTVAVLADPPREGFVSSRLVETSPLTAAEAADLYAAMLKDVCAAVAASGGELLVNYRPDEALPDAYAPAEVDAESELREVVGDALDSLDDVRFEVQVGETFAGRVGNTVTHLLESEGVQSAAAVTPSAAFLTRQAIDNAAMKLRRSAVVLGPSTGGRVYYAGFRDPVDFQDAYTAPAVETLTDRALDAGHDVDFLPMAPVVETGPDLAEALTHLRARERAGRIVPTHTVELLSEVGVVAEPGEGGLELRR